MLEEIKTQISQNQSLDEKKWIFFSCFDKDKNLLSSHGVLVTNKSLWTVIDMIYHGIIEPQKNDILSIICDIVSEVKVLTTMDEINKVDIAQSGISVSTLDYTKSWVILPQTKGIISLGQMLQIIKEKNHIEGNVIIHSFQSQKIKISLTS